MATHAFPTGPAGRPRRRDYVIGSLWIADVLLLGVLTFFLLVAEVQPWDSSGLAVLFAVMATLFVIRMALNRRDRDAARDRATLAARERRGF